MKVAVRYYSRGGNTKLLADSIAASASVNALSVDNEKAKRFNGMAQNYQFL